MKKRGLMGVCAVLLSGCGLKKFDCPYTEGVSCKSLSEVHERIHQGLVGKGSSQNKPKKENFFGKKTLCLDKNLVPSLDHKTPLRLPEQVLRIWLAPYASQEGLFHSGGFIYAVVSPAAWAESHS